MDPLWKRLVGGACGLGIMIAVLMLLKQGGVSGESLRQGQEVIVFAAAAVAIVLWFLKRKRAK
ncbi:MAG: hypothetical protein SFX73_31185 [Kofleriaceae bacterium]|nr:hypothetical protein [Kofleriaceae bacterium]